MSDADKEMREKIARKLWALEGARHDNAEMVMCKTRPGRKPMPYEPFEEHAESTWYPDADAILSLLPPPAAGGALDDTNSQVLALRLQTRLDVQPPLESIGISRGFATQIVGALTASTTPMQKDNLRWAAENMLAAWDRLHASINPRTLFPKSFADAAEDVEFKEALTLRSAIADCKTALTASPFRPASESEWDEAIEAAAKLLDKRAQT